MHTVFQAAWVPASSFVAVNETPTFPLTQKGCKVKYIHTNCYTVPALHDNGYTGFQPFATCGSVREVAHRST